MKLITKAILKQLPKIYAQDGKRDEAIAYLKIFDPCGRYTFYVTEACAILRDGTEVPIELLRNVRWEGNWQGSNVQLSVPRSANGGKTISGELELASRIEEPKLERGPDEVPGLLVCEDAGSSSGYEERVREVGGHRSGKEAGAHAICGGYSASQEREAGRRQAVQSGAGGARKTPGRSRSTVHERGSVQRRASKAAAAEERTVCIEDVTLFGYCISPLGPDCDELGYASLAEIESVRNRLGLGLERDTSFRPTTLGEIKKHHAEVLQ